MNNAAIQQEAIRKMNDVIRMAMSPDVNVDSVIRYALKQVRDLRCLLERERSTMAAKYGTGQ